MIKGVDLSHHNNNKGQNIGDIIRQYDFAIFKASEGVGWKDRKLDENYNKFVDINLKEYGGQKVYGFYHYARADANQPENEAEYFLSLVGHHAGKCIYALDFEQESFKNKNPDEWALRWLEHIYKRTGVKPIIYIQSSATELFKKVSSAGYPLWLAHWGTTQPRYKNWKDLAIWQYQGSPLDLNLFYGSIEQLRSLYLLDSNVEELQKEENKKTEEKKEVIEIKKGSPVHLVFNNLKMTLYVTDIKDGIIIF